MLLGRVRGDHLGGVGLTCVDLREPSGQLVLNALKTQLKHEKKRGKIQVQQNIDEAGQAGDPKHRVAEAATTVAALAASAVAAPDVLSARSDSSSLEVSTGSVSATVVS